MSMDRRTRPISATVGRPCTTVGMTDSGVEPPPREPPNWLESAMGPAFVIEERDLTSDGLTGPDYVERERDDGPGKIVVIIPAHDEALLIGEALESLAAQTRVADEVIVIADRCTDRTSQIAVANDVAVRPQVRAESPVAGDQFFALIDRGTMAPSLLHVGVHGRGPDVCDRTLPVLRTGRGVNAAHVRPEGRVATSQVTSLVEQPHDLAVQQPETGLLDQRNLSAAASDVGQGDIDRENLLLLLCCFGDDIAPGADDV